MTNQASSKFKVGDEVVVVRDSHALATLIGGYTYLGHIFKIETISTISKVAYPAPGANGAYLEDLELESIFNSPLNQALK